MSRLLMTLLTIQVLCNPALGKDYCKELTLSYDKNRFSFVNYNGVISVSSYSYPICYGTNTQEPGLPLVIIHVLIGADEEFVSASTKRSEQTLLSNISISPNPTWVHLGEVVTNVRKHFFLSENMNYNSPIRWTYLSMNIFGDAEMPIFVHQPRCFDNAEVSYNMEELHIDLHDVVNNNDTTSYRICVMSLYDNGASYYTIQESPIDEFFAEVPIGNDYSVCVTKPGCRPFVINCYNSGYIQNDTIADYSVCYSDNLQIGRNVTTHRPYGAVSVESGASLNIYGINGVTIKNSFEVKPGAVMEIRPGDY